MGMKQFPLPGGLVRISPSFVELEESLEDEPPGAKKQPQVQMKSGLTAVPGAIFCKIGADPPKILP